MRHRSCACAAARFFTTFTLLPVMISAASPPPGMMYMTSHKMTVSGRTYPAGHPVDCPIEEPSNVHHRSPASWFAIYSEHFPIGPHEPTDPSRSGGRPPRTCDTLGYLTTCRPRLYQGAPIKGAWSLAPGQVSRQVYSRAAKSTRSRLIRLMKPRHRRT